MLRPPREVINTLVHTPGGRPCGRKGSALKGIAGNIDPLLRSCKLCTRLCKLFACVARVVTRCARRTCTRAFLHVLLANIAHYNAVAARSHSSFGVNKRKFELLRARTRSLSRISHLCCGCCDQSCGRMIPWEAPYAAYTACTPCTPYTACTLTRPKHRGSRRRRCRRSAPQGRCLAKQAC